MATAKLLDDITQCPICTEVYTDPRVLPCVHTYCLKCIEELSKHRQPGYELACPLCRKEFALPSNGVSDLPKNFFLEKFLQAKELTSSECKTSPCDACSVGEVATVYCVECQQKLCRACEEYHRKFKVTRLHNTVGIGDKNAKDAVFEVLPANCEQHKRDPLRIYCLDCKLTICMMCYVKAHNSHACSDVSEIAEEFRNQMANDVDKIRDGFDTCTEMLERLEKEKNEFSQQAEKTGVEISEKAEQLKRMIDDHKEKLMNELSSVKQKRMKEIETLREEIERRLASLESYKKYVDEVRQKGTACDIARVASGLHDRADELMTFDAIERSLADLGHADVTFTSSHFVIDDVNKTVGHLKLVAQWTTPALINVVSSQGGDGVAAVASLRDDIFVLRTRCHKIEVYDANSFTLQRHVTFHEPFDLSASQWLTGLAASGNNNCLYVIDDCYNCVHRAELSGSNAVTKWSVVSGPSGLSVNRAHNVVVACYFANMLQEYTTHGSPVREICLDAGVTFPWHAVQLSTGDYVVSQNTSPGVVSVVGVDGQVRCSYGQSQTSDVRQMKYPASLAVTKNDDILVIDRDNNRILSMNSSLSSVQELALPVDDGIQCPMGLCLDESRGRLFVGELGRKHRVLVFAYTPNQLHDVFVR